MDPSIASSLVASAIIISILTCYDNFHGIVDTVDRRDCGSERLGETSRDSGRLRET